MKLPAQPSCALDDDDAASLEASLLEDVAPPEREKEDNTVSILCAAGAAVGALVFGYSLGFSSPALRRKARQLCGGCVSMAGGVG